MKAHLIDTHLVPKSRSSAKVKVKYQGHVSQKMGDLDALVFHKHLVFDIFQRMELDMKNRSMQFLVSFYNLLDLTLYHTMKTS